MRAPLVALALAGCSFPTPSADFACEVTADCEGGRVCERGFCIVAVDLPDGGADAIDASQFDCTSWVAPRHFMPCDLPPPTGALTLGLAGVYIYDTTTGMLVDPNGVFTTPTTMMIASGRAISVDGFAIGTGATLRVIGMQPLVVASWSTISITGTIDASSDATVAGPGADPAACATHAAVAGGNSGAGAGGGGGGGFGGIGGRGGNGDGAAGGAGGTAVAAPLLLGGCPGATGGAGDAAGGTGGRGGGAIQLTARDSITITGTINAGGAGGNGAAANNGNDADGGGGGGGAGGMVGLEAPALSLAATAIVAANGGGGGGGADQQAGGRGQAGQASQLRATGGAGINAGDGGLGSAGLVLAGGPGQASGAHGGGGAGGGAGFVVIVSPSPNIDAAAIVSPRSTAP